MAEHSMTICGGMDRGLKTKTLPGAAWMSVELIVGCLMKDEKLKGPQRTLTGVIIQIPVYESEYFVNNTHIWPHISW